MSKTCRVEFLPFKSACSFARGTNLLDGARMAGLPLKSTCGGKGTCGECFVRVVDGKAKTRPSAAVPEEVRRRGYILACQTEIEEDLTVELPRFEEQSIPAVASSRFLEERRDQISGTFEVDPPVRRLRITVPPPTLSDNSSDLLRLQRRVQKEEGLACPQAGLGVLKRLAQALRKKGGAVSAVLAKDGPGWTLVDIEPDPPGKRIYGLACDIGTTTVACEVVDLKDGRVLGSAAGFNQQLRCGEDVISRIQYAGKPGRLRELQNLGLQTVNALAGKSCREAGISSADIYSVSLAGNTTMTHLLLGLDPRFIREEPYIPTVNQVPILKAADLGLGVNPEARVVCAPAVGSYVGGDITAGLLSTPILRSAEKISLFIDAGTNGELVIGNRDWLATCACSAGPAFEGGGTKCGLPAIEGAIETVSISGSGRLQYGVIGGGKPKGLCGSGLVDLLAELFGRGFLDRGGKLMPEKAGKRLVRNGEGTGFLVEKATRSYWGRDHPHREGHRQPDPDEGAVFSACALLLKKIGLTYDWLTPSTSPEVSASILTPIRRSASASCPTSSAKSSTTSAIHP
jgi:uncharacterized 2Fe-2S/4Fe-4S cluster protein (DUF4445 family)